MKTNVKLIIGGILLAIVLIIVIANFPIIVIHAGERGVVFNNVSGIENRILGEGTHFRTPFVESVIIMPIRTQATELKEEGSNSAGTQDSQQVDIDIVVNWHLNPAKVNRIYQQTGDIDALSNNVLINNIRDSIKAGVSKYVALDVQKNRDTVAATALLTLQGKMEKYSVIVDNLSITNINFSAQFNQAIENAQSANQDAIAAENQVKTARAKAEAAVAQAQGQADSQKLVQQTLTPEILEKLYLEKWNGILPTYVGGGLPTTFLNIGK